MSHSKDLIPDFNQSDGLLPVVVQEASNDQVLMVAYMNEEAWKQTLATGEAVYFSRSRQRLWKKGESSGHVQRVLEVYVDCDADSILLKVKQSGGAACHEGYPSCFFRKWENGQYRVVSKRLFDPQQVYGGQGTAEDARPGG